MYDYQVVRVENVINDQEKLLMEHINEVEKIMEERKKEMDKLVAELESLFEEQ